MPDLELAGHVVTANRTLDGAVVYLGPGQRWTREIAAALFLVDDERERTLLAWARTQEGDVCDPYLARANRGPGGIRPVSARERIRAGGPEPVLARLGYA
jgi:hypothetical protein